MVLEFRSVTGPTVPGVIPRAGALALFKNFGDSALDFEIRACGPVRDWLIIKSRLGVAIQCRGFKDAGIAIPFPQRDVPSVPRPQRRPEHAPEVLHRRHRGARLRPRPYPGVSRLTAVR